VLLDVLVSISLLCNLVVIGLLIMGRLSGQVKDAIQAQQAALERGQEQLASTVRESLAEARKESMATAQMAREEMSSNFRGWSEAVGRSIETQLQSLSQTQKATADNLIRIGDAQAQRFAAFAQEQINFQSAHDLHTVAAVNEASLQQKSVLDSFQQQLAQLTTMNEQKLDRVRQTVETKLGEIQQDTTTKLEQMRATVDEKLHQTLEQRLGESFKMVSERLEQVQRGLGEMQTLASGVGDLKKVLTNVKTRGTLGEIQLDSLLVQTLSHDQYQKNVAVSSKSMERVDFAIRLPGQSLKDEPVWLPIDAKFPLEDYQRLLAAEDQGDLEDAAVAARLLEQRIRTEAKSIRDKYIHPPETTDFALMFLPIESLYAEVLRRTGLWEELQREYHIIVTGPTTISAILNSFQMGFRTLAIEQRSSEVWKLLGGVKAEFGKFGDILEKTQKKLQEASNTIDSASVRSRAIERRLRNVEALPQDQVSPAIEEDIPAALDD